ncbi:MAG: succinate dehydrogenase/fumarate reductase iron-sulfur subunit [Syntrophus sp. PtaU1.Bin208]|nr:MAG: succinate dehydrogenase/fumarate reductase iron-sulfur subunit [Syntrophus sp. PtaU1.Bin208]
MGNSEPVELFLESLNKHIGAEELLAMDACLDCHNCGSGCAWYLATGDVTLHPKYKKDFIRKVYYSHIHPIGRMATSLGLRSPLTEETLRQYMPYFWKCTSCGRCTLSCPLGLSNRSVVRLARTAFCDSGLIKENPVLNEVVEGSRQVRHSFSIPKEKIMLRYGLFLTHEKTLIPIDTPDVDYLFAPSAVENAKFPDFAIKIPQILNASGVSYTFSSRLTDTGTDAEHLVVDRNLSREMLEEVEDEVQRLAARRVLVSECGCDVRTFYVEAETILGRPFKFPVQSIDSLMLELIQSGALPVEKVPGRFTFHDPCKVVRLSGMSQLERELLNRVAADIIEMSPNGEYNYCCNGGTGPLRLPENSQLRRQISQIKAKQISATTAEKVVTPCAVCMLTLEDICQTYKLSAPDQRMSFMTYELVHEAMQRALKRSGQSYRTQMPAVFRQQTSEFIFNHSMAGLFEKISASSDMSALFMWLANDPVTSRYFRDHPDMKAYSDFKTYLFLRLQPGFSIHPDAYEVLELSREMFSQYEDLLIAV